MRDSSILPTYRGRDQMSLVEFIEDVEKCHFRTGHDTGANQNAMFVWNLLRSWAGMQQLEYDDLIQNHADEVGLSFEEMKKQYDEYREWKRTQGR